MAASPLRVSGGFTADRYWTEDKERALIAFFSQHSCLWNHKSESYKNRELRWKTLEHLRVLLSSHPPSVPFTLEDIKNKFKNLRTTFQRQYKMVKASKVCGTQDVFVPQWKHYQQLMFLQGCWEQEEGADEPPSPLSLPQDESLSVLTSSGAVISFIPKAITSSSSCVSSSLTVKCCWTEEKERELIDFYAEHGCLWNKKSENHNNRLLRLRLLDALKVQLSDHAVSFSVEDVKCKFKNLRTVFNREHKVAQASRGSAKPYVSKWKHYQQLLFLCESCDEDDGVMDELHILMTPEDKDVEQGDLTPSSTLSTSSRSSIITAGVSSSSSAPSSSTQNNARSGCNSTSPHGLVQGSQPSVRTRPSSPSKSSALSFTVSVPLESDSRCHWTEDKVQQLISFYSEHSCLWNHSSESYRNRLLRQSLLETLSSLLSDSETVSFTVEDIKTKFRNLKTTFQREHKSVSANKTCGSEDFYLPKWKYFRELMFLCDSCDEDDIPGDIPTPQAPPPCLYYHANSQTFTKLQQGFDAPPSPTPPDSRHSSPFSSPSASSSHTDTRTSSARKRACSRAPPTAGQMLDVMRMFCQSQAAVAPHAGFLKYVEECLNETPPDKVRKMKKKIIETIHGVAEEL
ncbi:hypothetical protein JOB18_022975 [Solea senegalensis]|uniref:MADF domain-containing protein n=1 Tax=Solea senegalensis TaxID=28829 RepID=A0AAV6R058_SOLSE|nr:uncharacterized protein LOC122758606 [Solea senegalensis]KAG7498881.1 hypothetical protein JOB18_022975 [Solea senegalensis]